VEWSFNIESEVLIEFTLLRESFPLVNIDDVPLLVETIVLVPSKDGSVLSIYSSLNINDLSFLVDNVSVLVSP
jgi:hypothetical protein